MLGDHSFDKHYMLLFSHSYLSQLGIRHCWPFWLELVWIRSMHKRRKIPVGREYSENPINSSQSGDAHKQSWSLDLNLVTQHTKKVLTTFLPIQMNFYKYITTQSETVLAPNAVYSYLRCDLNRRPGVGLGELLIVIPQAQVAEGNWRARNPQHRSPLIKCHTVGTAGHNPQMQARRAHLRHNPPCTLLRPTTKWVYPSPPQPHSPSTHPARVYNKLIK